MLPNIFEDSFLSSLLLEGGFFEPHPAERTALRVDIRECDKCYEIESFIPGLPKECLSISVDKGVLALEANYSQAKKNEEGKYLRREVRRMNAKRLIELPEGADLASIDAKLENGVLRVVVLKKVEKETAKKIEIR